MRVREILCELLYIPLHFYITNTLIKYVHSMLFVLSGGLAFIHIANTIDR